MLVGAARAEFARSRRLSELLLWPRRSREIIGVGLARGCAAGATDGVREESRQRVVWLVPRQPIAEAARSIDLSFSSARGRAGVDVSRDDGEIEESGALWWACNDVSRLRIIPLNFERVCRRRVSKLECTIESSNDASSRVPWFLQNTLDGGQIGNL